MRYAVAQAYPKADTNVRYWVKGDELKGIFLCISPVGTGVNAPGRSPQPRYGDADQTTNHPRGNCAGQLCVNDLKMNDDLHDRDEIEP